MKNIFLKIHPLDNVAVAIVPLAEGQSLSFDGHEFTLKESIPKGHKIALTPIKKGQDIIKYGFSIGKATEDISPYLRVHTHNVKTGLGEILSYSYQPAPLFNSSKHILSSIPNIQAYPRENGDIGIRNELWIIPLVGCINGLTDQIASLFRNQTDLSHTDGVFVWKHPYGCSQLGDDLAYTQKFLASLASHPNAGGVLLIGLGCENNTLDSFLNFLGQSKNSPRVRYFAAQQVEDEVEVALGYLGELSENMKKDKRTDYPFSKLRVGLKCGGSDAFSGITANPLLGSFADAFTQEEGCVLMTEVPEMFGAETILMDRAQSPKVFEDIVSLINDFKEYYNKNEQPIYENPSPGNKDGGITTLEDKSLGCTQKSGHAQVEGVLKYAQKVPQGAKNLWLLEGPGNDQIAVSNLGAAGAHIVLFSTGRGTPFGGFIPTLKVSTNSELAQRKASWIDFDAGVVLAHGDFNRITVDLAHAIQKIASGQKTKNELMGSREISIFKRGVVL